MSTLGKCIRKALRAKQISESDVDEVKRIYEDNVKDGMPPGDAAQAAVDEVIENAEAEREALVNDTESKGGRVERPRALLSKDLTPAGRRQTSGPRPTNSPPADESVMARYRRVERRAAKNLRKWWRKWMTSAAGLPPGVFQLRQQRDATVGAEELIVGYLTRDFDRAVRSKEGYGRGHGALPDETKEQLNALLAGDTVEGVPDNVREAVKVMRYLLDRLSAAMIQSGLVDITGPGAKTIIENIGRYLHRSYRAFDDPNWPDKVPQDVKDRAFNYIRAHMLRDPARGQPPTDAQVWGRVGNILLQGKAADHMGAFLRGRLLGEKDLTMLMRRGNIAKPIRELLGEYKDARVNFVKSATMMNRALANHMFLERVLEHGENFLFFREPIGDYNVQLAFPEGHSMEPLNGLYTHLEVKKAFEFATESPQHGALFRAYFLGNSMVKFGKVVVAPTTQMRNFLSATFFAIANGHVFGPARLKLAWNTVVGHLANAEHQRKYFIKLKRLGVVLDNPRAGELMEVMKDVARESDEAAVLLGGWTRRTYAFLTKIYQAGDDFWKIIGFEAETQIAIEHMGMTRSEAEKHAAWRVRNHYPTYSLVPRMVVGLRRTPLVGTFVSFPSEVVRTNVNLINHLSPTREAQRRLAHTQQILLGKDDGPPGIDEDLETAKWPMAQALLQGPASMLRSMIEIVQSVKADLKNPRTRGLTVQRLTGLLIAYSWAPAAAYLSMLHLGLTGDDDEAVKKVGPRYQRNSWLYYLGYDEDGYLKYIDLTYMNPYAYLLRVFVALLKDEPWQEILVDVGVELLEPFLGPEIAAGAIGEVVYNAKLDTGTRVRNPQDSVGDQTAAIVKHLLTSVGPGIQGNAIRIAKALTGRVSRSGRKYDLGDELAALVGFRATTLDLNTSLIYRGQDFKAALADATRVLSYVISDPNKQSDQKIVDAYERMKRARRKVWRDMQKIVDAVRQVGMTDDEIVAKMRAANVSAELAFGLIDNQFVPWRPGSQFMQKMMYRMEQSMSPRRWEGEAMADEFERRRQLVIDLVIKDLDAQETEKARRSMDWK